MDEMNQKLDLILSSQLVIQTEVIRLNSKIDNLDEKVNKRIDALDEKFEKKFEETNKRIDVLDQKFEQRFDILEETLEEDRKEIGNIINDIVKKIPA